MDFSQFELPPVITLKATKQKKRKKKPNQQPRKKITQKIYVNTFMAFFLLLYYKICIGKQNPYLEHNQ